MDEHDAKSVSLLNDNQLRDFTCKRTHLWPSSRAACHIALLSSVPLETKRIWSQIHRSNLLERDQMFEVLGLGAGELTRKMEI